LGAKNEEESLPVVSPGEIPAAPLTLEEEIEKQPGVPKTPAGWWTFGLTIMAILIAVALWFRYY
jgi:hypothetical protein